MIYIFLIVVSLTYFTLIISLIIGYNKISVFNEENTSINNEFTIIIPFRNEAENISALAVSLQQMNYPKDHFEIIFINDESTDNSVLLLTQFIIKNENWKLIDNIRKSNSPKKDAIQTAINKAKYQWVVTTDSDCRVPKKWLQTFSSFINKNKKVRMVAAPVTYKTNKKKLHQFQLLDFLSLIGTTIGSFGLQKPFMCNGANLCYHKKTFIALNGFEDNNHIASGDDVFLLEKFSNYHEVAYLKSVNALVKTMPEQSFNNLVNQRIRWASKTTATKSIFSKSIGVIVILMNLILLWAFFFGLWNTTYMLLIIIIITLKLIIDFVLLKKTYLFTQQKLGLVNYVLSSIFYPFFVIFVVIKSFFVKVKWKGRNV